MEQNVEATTRGTQRTGLLAAYFVFVLGKRHFGTLGRAKEGFVFLPGGGIEVLDATVDERGKVGRSLLDGIGLLGDRELLEKLIKDLDAGGVLGSDHFDFCVELMGESKKMSKK